MVILLSGNRDNWAKETNKGLQRQSGTYIMTLHNLFVIIWPCILSLQQVWMEAKFNEVNNQINLLFTSGIVRSLGPVVFSQSSVDSQWSSIPGYQQSSIPGSHFSAVTIAGFSAVIFPCTSCIRSRSSRTIRSICACILCCQLQLNLLKDSQTSMNRNKISPDYNRNKISPNRLGTKLLPFEEYCNKKCNYKSKKSQGQENYALCQLCVLQLSFSGGNRCWNNCWQSTFGLQKSSESIYEE